MTTLHVFKVEKLSETAIDEALGTLDVTPAPKSTLVDKAGALRKCFEDMDRAGQGDLLTGACDCCGEVSSVQFGSCPFCGTGEAGLETPAELPGPDDRDGDGSGDEDTPPPDYGDEQTPTDPAPPEGGGDQAVDAQPAPRVNPGSLAAPEPARTQKLVRKPRKGAKVTASVEVTGMIEVPTPALDLYVAEVRRLHGIAGMAIYALASKLADGETSGVWKTRLGDDGKARYKTFRAFCDAELGFTGDYAYSLMRIKSRYKEEEFAQLGTTKLRLLAKVEDDQVRDAILQEAKQGATRATIETYVHDATGNKPSTKGQVSGDAARATAGGLPKQTGVGAKPVPARSAPVKLPDPKRQGVTVVLLEGKKKFPLFAAPKSKDETPRRAKRVVDKPWGKIPLVVNDVEVLVTITVDNKGQLEGWAESRRVDPTK